jgi:CO/xanthine dehydrogenase Mo-binding subunit
MLTRVNQGMMFAESFIEHIAKHLKIPETKIREQNYYTEGMI